MSQATFIDNFLSEKECDLISNFILTYEDTIKRQGEDFYPGTAKNSLTGRHPYFNYLNYAPGQILIPKFRALFGKTTIQCWANTFRKGEGIKTHTHSNLSKGDPTFVAGNLFIDGPEHIGTIYDGELKESKRGTLAYFPSTLPHSVNKNTTDQVRISMAIDVYEKINPSMQEYLDDDPEAYKKRYYKIE